ncbi:PREDICTED: proteoglycan 4-like [Vollenhovia emeryi]|uniref:proteoglycan 4-like n=1 Tax=Vollenhovia emeryi TaxID=411798 RepID=UPI0005F52E4F|nr:PREDICTED: proteoglycan 4-like [Vollenhovia emeryi]
MSDPTARIPTRPKLTPPSARPPLVGVTSSRPPGSAAKRGDAERFWRKAMARRTRNNPERIRRGLDGKRPPPESIPEVHLSEEENEPSTNAAPSSAPTAGPTIKFIEVYPPHTFRLLRPPGTARSSTVSTVGAAAPADTTGRKATGTTAPTTPSLTRAATAPGPIPDTAQRGTAPQMPRDPFCIRPTTPREERDVLVDGCLIRVPIGSKRWRTRIGKVKYALRLDPTTGNVRHWSKRQL